MLRWRKRRRRRLVITGTARSIRIITIESFIYFFY
jgi:hypothetical protein